MKALIILLISFFAMSQTLATTPDEIIDFWFGPISEPYSFNSDKVKMWFVKNPETDKEIRERFETTLQAAHRGELDHWKKAPRGRLALILLLDQFPRNMYRGTPQSFAYDAQALQIALEGMKEGADKKLNIIERTFFYFPLEHSEDLKMQELSVSSFEQLMSDAPNHLKENFASYLSYAIKHKEIIERFGRYPHRNDILGRQSTEEETFFLTQPGSSF